MFLKEEYSRREKKLYAEQEAAVKRDACCSCCGAVNHNKADGIRNAYLPLFRALEDEIRQRMGLPGIVWQKKRHDPHTPKHPQQSQEG